MKKLKHIKLFESQMSEIFTKKTIYSVDASDLAGLIQNLYGQDPEIEASLELGHDDTFELEANSDEYDESEFLSWSNHPDYSRGEIYMLMHKLAYDGHIENGDYIIKTY